MLTPLPKGENYNLEEKVSDLLKVIQQGNKI